MALAALAAFGAAAACGHYQTYRSAPLDARAPFAAIAFRTRRLDDPRLARFLQTVGASRDASLSDTAWTPRELALVALYQRAELAEARAALAIAGAAERTVGVRPEASASASVDRASRVDEGKSSLWSVSLTTGLTYEIGGKRAARIARARAGTLAARLRLDAAAWDAAQVAAQAAVTSLAADRDVESAEAEARAVRTTLTLLRARYAEGRISLADVAQSETELWSATLATAAARTARTDARRTLARALAVPVTEVERLAVRPSPTDGCATLDARGRASADSLPALALQRRFDLGVALADYVASEADVRSEIARQYPDLTVGPGLAWDQGVRRWAFGVGTPRIPRARNRGPIAEALGRRAVQAARVRVVQDSVLAGVDGARTGCETTRGEIAAADSLHAAAARARAVAQAAYDRGETGRTEVALADLALVRAERARQQAVEHRALAGVALETAAGTWLTGAPEAWPDLTAPALAGLAAERTP